MTTIAIANQKGGTGKTTTAVTLAHACAQAGLKTLIVDLDSQGNVADSLGMEPGRELSRLLMPGLDESVRSVQAPSGRINLDVIRADKSTVELKGALMGVMLRETVLARKLEDDLYHDAIILDCAPSADLLHLAALVAADYLIVPTRLDQLSIKGVRDMLDTLRQLHAAKITVCKLGGVLPTFYERTTKETQAQLEHLTDAFRKFVLPPIPQDTTVREANRDGHTLYEFAPACRALAGVENGSGIRKGGYIQAWNALVQRGVLGDG